jgi:4-hydroxythreonine-4-phosphate dehydrogenase
MRKPLLALTMGDPAGVGPEVVVGAWADPQLHQSCRPVAIGHPEVLRRAVIVMGLDQTVVEIAAPEEAEPSLRQIPCIRVVDDGALDVAPATIDPRAGQAAYDALVRAAELAMAGRVDGITTAPLHKAALWQAGHHYPGHTELLAELCGIDDFAMMLYLAHDDRIRGPAGLGVVHVTLHMALSEVFASLTSESVLAKIRLAEAAMAPLIAQPSLAGQQPFTSPSPRIGVCALNPHGGESGLFGREETTIILPAVERARAEGIAAEGPYPTDTLMVRAADGEFDAVVAMYHDQGHIALKLLGMHRAVNVTLGLPIVRTSVAHGTAFDLAWCGVAQTGSMIEAVRVASQLALERMAPSAAGR